MASSLACVETKCCDQAWEVTASRGEMVGRQRAEPLWGALRGPASCSLCLGACFLPAHTVSVLPPHLVGHPLPGHGPW